MDKKRGIHFLILVAILAPNMAFADILAATVAPCRFWTPSQGGGFVCQNIPATILVPEANSVAKALKLQSDRIAELEKKLVELEESCRRP